MARARRSRRGPTGRWCCRCPRGRSRRSCRRTWPPRQREACTHRRFVTLGSIHVLVISLCVLTNTRDRTTTYLRVERHTARDDGPTAASFLPEMELPVSPFAATGWTETAAREAIVARAWCAQLRGRVLLVWKCVRTLNSTDRDEDLERVVVGGDRFWVGAEALRAARGRTRPIGRVPCGRLLDRLILAH
jgi:hypothetical protein